MGFPDAWLATSFALLVAASTLYFGAVNEADNDLWMHLFVGRLLSETGEIPRTDRFSYTAAGLPWVDHEWLAEWIAFRVFELVGPPGLWVGKLLLVASMIGGVWCNILRSTPSRPVGGPEQVPAPLPTTSQCVPAWVWGPVLVLVIAAAARGFSFRPQLWTYTFLPLLLWLLRAPEPASSSRTAAVAALFLAWVNLHGGFILGWGILGLYTAWGLGRGIQTCLRRFQLCLAAVVASVCNPYGWRLFPYLLDELGRSHPITEWQPIRWFEPEHGAFFGLLGVWFLTLPFTRLFRDRGWMLVLAGITAYFAARHQRHVPVFALCVAVPVAQQCGEAGRWLASRGFQLSAAGKAVLALGLLVLAGWQVSLTVAHRILQDRMRIVFAENEYPARLVSAMRRAGVVGNLAVPLDWGGYVLWHLAPGVKPSLDGRFATVYPEHVVRDNFAFFGASPGWERLLEDYPTEAVLLAASARHPLRTRPDWVEIASDDVAVLYVRREVAGRFRVRASDGELSRARPGWLFFP